MPISTPDWVKDAIFYQIFPDRFAKSDAVPKPCRLQPWEASPTRHGYKGGDLLGVVEHLDYLQDLGVNAIYFNPIFQSTANHRYHTYDYYRVDPLLGGNAALDTLLDEAHRRGMFVVLDGVFNHASRGFFQFNDILENGPESPYLDWFIIKRFPLNAYADNGSPDYEAWWNLPALPKFNIGNPSVRDFLWDVAEHWVQKGIDGWRLDVPEEIKDEAFWTEFRRRVKRANPDAYVVGEVWHEASIWLRGDRFDAVMNYPFSRSCLGFFGGPTLDVRAKPGGYALSPMDAATFAQEVERQLSMYDWEVGQSQLNLLSSHDTPRFLTMIGGHTERLQLAILFQMTTVGAPCIYYGDEIGMTGGPDPDCRRAMPWDEKKWDTALLDYVKSCTALRRAHPALRRGAFRTLYARDGAYSYGRRLHDQTVIVVINNSGTALAAPIPVTGYLADGTALRNVWSRQSDAVVADGCLKHASVPALSGVVFVADGSA
jgi:cyclomaltodextrinase